MANYFEKVAKYQEDEQIAVPHRGTRHAAGYDLAAAADYVIPALDKHIDIMRKGTRLFANPVDLSEIAQITKDLNTKPTLVSTGLKCHLDLDKYLEITARSSLPLKHWLIIANAPGIIDADYYGNESNDGEIFIQLINLSPFDIVIHKGDKIAQGIIKSYSLVADDITDGVRTGGFGSTSV